MLMVFLIICRDLLILDHLELLIFIVTFPLNTNLKKTFNNLKIITTHESVKRYLKVQEVRNFILRSEIENAISSYNGPILFVLKPVDYHPLCVAGAAQNWNSVCPFWSKAYW